MVVARKTPVAPAPPVSRTNSTQALPRRTAKAKATPSEPTPSSSGNEPKPPKKPTDSQKAPQKKKKEVPPSSLSKRFFLLLLSIFAIYAATVCRSDDAFSSPVCRGLVTYRTYVLEPYLIPPIRTYLVPPLQAAINHPAVAPLHPYAHSTYAAVQPRASAAAKFVKAKYDAHVVPAAAAFYDHKVLPFYEHKVIPVYNTYLDPHVRPYILVYRKHIAPTYSKAHARIGPYVERAKPHAQAAYVATRKYSYTAYQTAKPHALAAYARVKPHAIQFSQRIKVRVLQGVAYAAEARREFVDPHVRRIWDKVVEAEATVAAATNSITETPTITSTQEELASASSVIQASVAAESGVAADVASSAAEAASSSSSAASVSASLEAAFSSSAAAASSSAEAVASSSVEAAAAASSSAEAAASPAPPQETPPPEATQTPSPLETTPTATESETAASASSIISASLHIPSVASGQAPLPSDVEEFDDFLRDIGLDETPAPAESSAPEADPASEPPAVPTPDPEERLAATAERRADIVGRHQVWQARLDALIVEREDAFRTVLDGVRKDAVTELGGMFPAEKGVVGSVEAEAGKLMKGLEGYLHKLEAKKPVDEEEKEKEKWGKVVEKVEDRFSEKVRKVQGEVHEWYMGIREGEGREVLHAAAEVKTLAEKAQADIGLDYAWLDDVTYQDWQKYHDLMRTSERFASTLESIQNGTHANPQGDVLVEALNNLEAEMQDVISGFLVRLQAIVREAKEGVFSPAPPPPSAEEDEASKPEEEEPRVSILPIEPTPEVKAAEGAEHLFVGKDPEAVARALEGLEIEKAELVVEAEVEVESEEEGETDKRASDHVEL